MSTLAPNFGFEVDFLPIGEGESSGDAICLRWGYDLDSPNKNKQSVCIIDGGYTANGDDIVNHLKRYYGTTTVDCVINTHPHRDHIGGLHTVIEKCQVHNLVIHQPWTHNNLKGYFDDERVTNDSIRKHLEDLNAAKALVDTATKKEVNLIEPSTLKPLFKNLHGVTAYVLGPTQEYYHQLLPDFKSTPTTNNNNDNHRLEGTRRFVPAKMCPLTDEGNTSAENNSSVILAFKLPDDNIFLFTGDAGMPALSRATVLAYSYSINLAQQICFFQVPHHGSIQNLGPSVLDLIFGSSTGLHKRPPIPAYISVSKSPAPLHPSKHVINALKNYNVDCYRTGGQTITYHVGRVPPRFGWVSLESEPYSEFVEEVK